MPQLALKSRYQALKSRTITFFKAKPLISFAVVLVLLFALIAAGNAMREPEVEETVQDAFPKPVATYQIGRVPKLQVSAKIEKSGVITITSQTSGIVRAIPVKEGQTVTAGATVVNLASNYVGANAMSKQRQIAAEQYNFNKENFSTQNELIEQQKRLARLSEDNQEELRKISEDSLEDTDNIIRNTKENLDLLEDMIQYYRDNITTPDMNDFATDESVLLGLEQQRVGILNALQAAEQAQRSLEYSTDEDEAAVKLTKLTKDNSIKQLDLQKKSLELNLEVSKLSLQLAQINESMMYPAAPFSGTVERVHVKVGEAVNPGTPLITFTGSQNSIKAVALVSQSVAEQVSRLEPSLVTINGRSFEVYPSHISTEATDNRLFSIIYPISFGAKEGQKGYDAELSSSLNVVDGQYITVEVPVGYSHSMSSFPFVPLDAVYQTQDTAYIFVIENDKAASREIEIGSIFGRYIEVTEGLVSSDEVILDRTVLAGDPVVKK